MSTPNFVITGASKYYVLEPNVPEVTNENAEQLIQDYSLEREEFVYCDYDYEQDKEIEKIDLDKLQVTLYEYETRDFWDWEVNEIRESIKNDLKLLERKKKTYQILVDVDIDEWSDYAGKGYELHKFARVELILPVRYTKNSITAETSIHIEYEIGIRSGYFDGANLDYEIEISFGESNEYYDWFEFEKEEIIEKVIDDLEYEMDLLLPVGEYTTEKMKEEMQERAKNKYSLLENRMNEIEDFLEKIFERYASPYQKIAQFSNGEAIYQKV